MDREKLLELDIEETELEAIEDALEEKQNDLESRIDAAESNGNLERKNQLEAELKKVEELLEQVKEEKEAAKSEQTSETSEEKKPTHGAVPTSVVETDKHTVPTALDATEELADNVADKLKIVKNVFSSKKREKTEDKKEKEEKKTQEAEDKKHEAELKAKAAELRKKAAEEESAKAKAEKEAAKEDGADTDVVESEDEYAKAFNAGVTAYATGKYAEAFPNMFKVANAGEKSGLSDDKLGQAEQILARMYKNGDGTSADEKRAWFWFEKAAEHKNIEGCLAMGQHNADLTPKSPAEEKEFRENALKYFEMAGNAGSKVGKEKFVDVCIKKKEHISNADVRVACRFLDDLRDLEDDVYFKQILADRKKELRKGKAELNRRKRNRNNNSAYNGSMDIIAIIGAFITTFGVMLLCHHILSGWDTLFNFSWIIPKYFLLNVPNTRYIVGYDILEEFTGPGSNYPYQAGLWSLKFIPIGFFLSSLSRVETRGKIANFFCEVSLYFSAGAGFIAFYYYMSMRGYTEIQWDKVIRAISILIIILGAVLCARILAKIVGHFRGSW